MRFNHLATLFVALSAMACSRTPHGPTLATAGLASATATLNLAPARAAYALQYRTVHHWEADDITQYVVDLKVRDAVDPTRFQDPTPPVSVSFAAKGPEARTQAVFANPSQGAFYRAYVTARGNVHGDLTQPTQLLTSVPAEADFDFTAAQDVAPSASQTVTVTLDGVPFNGSGGLSLGVPSPGVYLPPSDGPSVAPN